LRLRITNSSIAGWAIWSRADLLGFLGSIVSAGDARKSQGDLPAWRCLARRAFRFLVVVPAGGERREGKGVCDEDPADPGSGHRAPSMWRSNPGLTVITPRAVSASTAEMPYLMLE
jgi:hypothetical protein